MFSSLAFRFRLLIVLCLSLPGLYPHASCGQTAGERVVVTANTDTKIYKENVDKVYTGDIHTVIAVNGKWCALSRVKGWLPSRYVLSLSSAMQLYQKRIKIFQFK